MRAGRRAILKSMAATAAVTVSPGWGRDRPVLDVVVVGAGLSGLEAALLLEEQGLTV